MFKFNCSVTGKHLLVEGKKKMDVESENKKRERESNKRKGRKRKIWIRIRWKKKKRSYYRTDSTFLAPARMKNLSSDQWFWRLGGCTSCLSLVWQQQFPHSFTPPALSTGSREQRRSESRSDVGKGFGIPCPCRARRTAQHRTRWVMWGKGVLHRHAEPPREPRVSEWLWWPEVEACRGQAIQTGDQEI